MSGEQPEAAPADGRRNAVLAFVLNAFLPPLGYVYARSLRAGLIYIVAFLLLFSVILGVTWLAPPGFYLLGTSEMLMLAFQGVFAIGLGTHAALLARENRVRARVGVGGWVLAILICLSPIAVAQVVRNFVIRPFTIPSASMNPTLKEGDLIGVTGSALCDREGVGVGDVVSFRKPASTLGGPSGPYTYVGRIVAKAGQTVAMVDGVLTIDGKPVPRASQGEYADPTSAFPEPMLRFRETLPNGRVHDTLDFGPDGHLDDTALVSIPPGHWFIMGDNRDNAIDSRVYGPVPAASVCGVAVKILYSSDGTRIGARP